jgi:hypothetical protein
MGSRLDAPIAKADAASLPIRQAVITREQLKTSDSTARDIVGAISAGITGTRRTIRSTSGSWLQLTHDKKDAASAASFFRVQHLTAQLRSLLPENTADGGSATTAEEAELRLSRFFEILCIATVASAISG